MNGQREVWSRAMVTSMARKLWFLITLWSLRLWVAKCWFCEHYGDLWWCQCYTSYLHGFLLVLSPWRFGHNWSIFSIVPSQCCCHSSVRPNKIWMTLNPRAGFRACPSTGQTCGMNQSARLEVQRRVLFQSSTRRVLIFRNHQRANNMLSCRKWQSLTPLAISRTKTQARTVPQREKQQRPGANGSLEHTCGGPSSQPFKVVITWLISPAELVTDVNYRQSVICLTSVITGKDDLIKCAPSNSHDSTMSSARSAQRHRCTKERKKRTSQWIIKTGTWHLSNTDWLCPNWSSFQYLTMQMHSNMKDWIWLFQNHWRTIWERTKTWGLIKFLSHSKWDEETLSRMLQSVSG